MRFIAHRGYVKKDEEENTIKAFENAYNDDYFIGFELDVRETKDKEFVVLHDAFINRVSNGTGLIHNYKYKDLLKYNFGTTKYPSKILKLKDVLNKFPNKLIVVELKKINSVKKITKLLNKYSNIYVASFNSNLLKEIIYLKPKFKVGIFNNIINSNTDYKVYDFVGFIQKIASDKNIINYFKNNNIEIMMFLIKDENELKNINKEDSDYMYFIVDEKIDI